jgi:hypothetical protein
MPAITLHRRDQWSMHLGPVTVLCIRIETSLLEKHSGNHLMLKQCSVADDVQASNIPDMLNTAAPSHNQVPMSGEKVTVDFGRSRSHHLWRREAAELWRISKASPTKRPAEFLVLA